MQSKQSLTVYWSTNVLSKQNPIAMGVYELDTTYYFKDENPIGTFFESIYYISDDGCIYPTMTDLIDLNDITTHITMYPLDHQFIKRYLPPPNEKIDDAYIGEVIELKRITDQILKYGTLTEIIYTRDLPQ